MLKESSKGDHSPQAKARPSIYYNSFTQAYLRLALRGILLHHILLSRMVWWEGRATRWWKLSGPCYMIKDFQSFYGLKLQSPPYMYKINALIKHWVPKLLKKCSPPVIGKSWLVMMSPLTKIWLSKLDNLLTLSSSQEVDTREPKEKDDESMPDVEEPMDPIDPPPHEPSSSRKRPSWLRGLLDDAEGHATPRGTFLWK